MTSDSASPLTDPEFQKRPVLAPCLAEESPAFLAPEPAKKGLLRAFTALRHRNYRLYWFSQMISIPGAVMQAVGEVWLVLELSHSAWLPGLVGALQALPILLFTLFAGVFADRWPKRRVLLITQSVAMLQASLLWILTATGTLQLWHLYILALLLGFTNSLGRPTSQAFVIELVGRAELPNAVALRSSLSTLASIIGPGLGGIIIATGGVTLLFLLNALTFLPAILGLALIRHNELHIQIASSGEARKEQNTWQSLGEGLSYVWKTPAVLLMILLVGLVLLFGSNFNVVLPLFATDVLHVGAAGFGFLSAAGDIGALLCVSWLAWSNRQPTIRGVLLATLAFGMLEVFFAISRIYFLSLILLVSVGFMETAFAMQALTTLQTVTPNSLSARVMSVQVLFFDGSLPLGYLLMGWLSGLFGAPIAMASGALFCLIISAASWIWRKPAEKNLAAAAQVAC